MSAASASAPVAPPRATSLAPPLPPKDTPAGSDPTVDLVLIFQASPKSAKVRPTAQDVQNTRQEYTELLGRLQKVGLQTTSRPGIAGTGTVLIFVKASDQTLDKAIRIEATNDFLHGVPSTVPAGSDTTSLSSADRVRLVHALVSLPPVSDKSAQHSLSGAGILVGDKDLPHLVDITAIHDPAFNSSWLKKWSSLSSAYSLRASDMDDIQTHFGGEIGYYYSFLLFYFHSLLPTAVLGASFWAVGLPLNAMYSLVLVSWACIFVESWRMKERKLAVRWNSVGLKLLDRRRPDFKPKSIRKDPATGEEQEVFEWWRREIRSALSIPVMVLFAAILAATMTSIFAIEVFVAKLYHGPGSQIIPHVPTALFVLVIPRIMGAWQSTASSLTSWENHYGERAHSYALTIKVFALQMVVAYGALTMSAFIYIPFGQHIMDEIISRGFFAQSVSEGVARGALKPRADGGISFDINPDRMHTQLFASSVTAQITNAVTELVVPIVLRKVAEWRASRNDNTEKDLPPSPGEKSGESVKERAFLKRIRAELALPHYDTFGDYAEMATQFGYICLWSVVWPLSPVMGFINNAFELRSDAAKMCLNARRPIPARAESIGPWLEVLGFIAWLSAMSNAALIYLFQQSPDAHLEGHSPYETTLRTHLHPAPNATVISGSAAATAQQLVASPHSFLPSFLPRAGASGALVAALLCALASEHAYGLVRALVRHILERALWRGSAEETTLRANAWTARTRAAQSVLSSAATDGSAVEPVRRRDVSDEDRQGGFWDAGNDVGLDFIGGSAKTE